MILLLLELLHLFFRPQNLILGKIMIVGRDVHQIFEYRNRLSSECNLGKQIYGHRYNDPYLRVFCTALIITHAAEIRAKKRLLRKTKMKILRYITDTSSSLRSSRKFTLKI